MVAIIVSERRLPPASFACKLYVPRLDFHGRTGGLARRGRRPADCSSSLRLKCAGCERESLSIARSANHAGNFLCPDPNESAICRENRYIGCMKLTAIIYPDSETDLQVAECPEIGPASQGRTACGAPIRFPRINSRQN